VRVLRVFAQVLQSGLTKDANYAAAVEAAFPFVNGLLADSSPEGEKESIQ